MDETTTNELYHNFNTNNNVIDFYVSNKRPLLFAICQSVIIIWLLHKNYTISKNFDHSDFDSSH